MTLVARYPELGAELPGMDGALRAGPAAGRPPLQCSPPQAPRRPRPRPCSAATAPAPTLSSLPPWQTTSRVGVRAGEAAEAGHAPQPLQSRRAQTAGSWRAPSPARQQEELGSTGREGCTGCAKRGPASLLLQHVGPCLPPTAAALGRPHPPQTRTACCLCCAAARCPASRWPWASGARSRACWRPSMAASSPLGRCRRSERRVRAGGVAGALMGPCCLRAHAALAALRLACC